MGEVGRDDVMVNDYAALIGIMSYAKQGSLHLWCSFVLPFVILMETQE